MHLNTLLRPSLLATALAGLACAAALSAVARPTAAAADDSFSLSSPDIAPGSQIGNRFVLSGFGCSGDNVSPALEWKNAPARHQVLRGAGP